MFKDRFGYESTCEPSATAVERETLKTLMQMTNERLNEAVTVADAILSEIRGAFPCQDEEQVNAGSAMEAERINRDTAERVCMTIKEIAMQLGVRA